MDAYSVYQWLYYKPIQPNQCSKQIRNFGDGHGPQPFDSQLSKLLIYCLVVEPCLFEPVSETSCPSPLMSLGESPRFGGQSGHVVEDCRVGKIGAHNGIGKGVHLYVFCESQTLRISSRWLPCLPDVPCKMFASSEAQAARRVIGAVEPLRLLFLGSSSICIDTFLI